MRKTVSLLLCLLLLVSCAAAQNGHITNAIEGKSVNEKAKIKALEISNIKNQEKGIKEIKDKPNALKYDLINVSYNPDKNTLRLQMRVWLNGREKAIHNPVDVYNPPILIVTSSSYDDKTDKYSYTTKEDVSAALDEVIYRVAMSAPDGIATFAPETADPSLGLGAIGLHLIQMTGVLNNDICIDGADPELWVFATADGFVSTNPDGTFTALRDAWGDGVSNTGTSSLAWLQATATSNVYDYLVRGIFVFNTAGVGEGNTVTAVRFDFYGVSKLNQLGAPNLSITGCNPESLTYFVGSDYHQFHDTKYATDIQYGDFVTSGYNNITLNSVGIAAINKTGLTPLMARLKWDVGSSTTGLVWVTSPARSQFTISTMDEVGTSQDPALFITYTVNHPTIITKTSDWTGATIPFYLLAGISGAAVTFIMLRRKQPQKK